MFLTKNDQIDLKELITFLLVKSFVPCDQQNCHQMSQINVSLELLTHYYCVSEEQMPRKDFLSSVIHT